MKEEEETDLQTPLGTRPEGPPPPGRGGGTTQEAACKGGWGLKARAVGVPHVVLQEGLRVAESARGDTAQDARHRGGWRLGEMPWRLGPGGSDRGAEDPGAGQERRPKWSPRVLVRMAGFTPAQLRQHGCGWWGAVCTRGRKCRRSDGERGEQEGLLVHPGKDTPQAGTRVDEIGSLG